MVGKQEEQSLFCHPLHPPCTLSVTRSQLHMVENTSWDRWVEEGQKFSPPVLICVALLRCGHWAGDGWEGRATGSHLPGAEKGETYGPATFSAVETIWVRSGLGVHSSRKAFILHIWTRTLQSKNLE